MTCPIVFADLDDTLFQTARKMAAPKGPARLAAEATNGQHSYMTPAQDALVRWLAATTRLIPVTARSTEATARVRIPFADHRVCSNGAVILGPDGRADPGWQTRVDEVCAVAAGGLAALMARAGELQREARTRFWLVEEAGRPVYFCLKSNGPETWIDGLEGPLAEAAGPGFARHRNGNNLSFTPAGISKRAAVVHLRERLDPGGEAPVLGIGDSLTDLPFLRACDMMVLPAASQAAAALPA